MDKNYNKRNEYYKNSRNKNYNSKRTRQNNKGLIKRLYKTLLYKSISLFSICIAIMAVGLYITAYENETYGGIILCCIAIPFIVMSILATKSIIYKINKYKMVNDLECWSARIIGAVLIGVAFVMGLVSAVFLITPIVGIPILIFTFEILAVGLFTEYRSVRRTGMFVYVR